MVLMLAAVIMVVGCADRSGANGEAFSFHTTPEASQLQRVGVLPFLMGDGVGRSAGAIDDSMAASLRELGLHEVVAITAESRDRILPGDVLYQNNITTAQLMRLRDALHVDGVVVGRVDQFTSFDPIAMGVTAHLVSCLDGQVAWSATGHFDGQRLEIQRDIHRWFDQRQAVRQASTGGWKLTLQTPSLFSRYVTDRLVSSLPYREAN